MKIFQNSATRLVFVIMVVTLCVITTILAFIGDSTKFNTVFEVFKVTIAGIVVYFTAKSTQDAASLQKASTTTPNMVVSTSTETPVQAPEHHDLSEFNV